MEQGRRILDESGLAVQAASSMAHGAQMVVHAVEGLLAAPQPSTVRSA
jgi:succinyl-CoA synthetase beta subunit